MGVAVSLAYSILSLSPITFTEQHPTFPSVCNSPQGTFSFSEICKFCTVCCTALIKVEFRISYLTQYCKPELRERLRAHNSSWQWQARYLYYLAYWITWYMIHEQDAAAIIRVIVI